MNLPAAMPRRLARLPRLGRVLRGVLVLTLGCCSAAAWAETPLAAGLNLFEGVEGGLCLDFSDYPIEAHYFSFGSLPVEQVISLRAEDLYELDPYGPRFALAREAMSVSTSGRAEAFEFTLPTLVSTDIVTIDFEWGPGFYQVLVLPQGAAGFPGRLALRAGANADGGEILADLDADGLADSSFTVDYDVIFNETCGCSSRTLRVRGESLRLVADAPYASAAPDWVDGREQAGGFFPALASPQDDQGQTLEFVGERLRLALRLAAVEPDPSIPGDANLDGHVNLADFIILKRNYNSPAAVWGQGDFTGDGRVDIADFILLKRNYNRQ